MTDSLGIWSSIWEVILEHKSSQKSVKYLKEDHYYLASLCSEAL